MRDPAGAPTGAGAAMGASDKGIERANKVRTKMCGADTVGARAIRSARLGQGQAVQVAWR